VLAQKQVRETAVKKVAARSDPLLTLARGEAGYVRNSNDESERNRFRDQ
jgi:hypothetical protein